MLGSLEKNHLREHMVPEGNHYSGGESMELVEADNVEEEKN